MTIKNYISDSVPIDDSIESIISEVEKRCFNINRGTSQFGLPGLEDYYVHISGPRLFIIANGQLIDGDTKRMFSPSQLEEGIEGIERSFNDAIVVCFRKSDYKKFSSVMEKKAKLSGGMTPGWGSDYHITNDVNYLIFTFGRNPLRVPLKY